MYISVNWIKDFVDLGEPSKDDIYKKITLSCAEVEKVEESKAYLKKIVVAQIKSIKKHPEADKLNLVTFDIGNSETKEVVCGAPNVREGIKVPFAPIGTTLPGDFTLEPKKIRGILSEGMLCSSTELELGEDSSGLLELASDAPLGQDLLTYLGQEADTILDIDNKSLTHRPDLWGHYGFSREFAAIFELPLKNPFDESWRKKLEQQFTSDPSPIVPQVESDSSGLIYLGLSLSGVTVGESPQWMKNRLEAVGLRAINNIVDISNYVMLELGMPLHIFDRNLIKDNVVRIHNLKEETNFITLDDVNRVLLPGDTVISDSEKPLVIGGIMGGANSGVNEKTTEVFIEVANWKAALTRKTSTRLGLRTESSMRYEKSLDSQLCMRTMYRTLELILKLCPEANVIGKIEAAGPEVTPSQALVLNLTAAEVTKKLGVQVGDEQIIKILSSLGFECSNNNEGIKVIVPSYRATKDVECSDDLVEEIGRIIGYDNITPVSPVAGIKVQKLSQVKKVHRKIQDFFVLHGGLLEIMTYPLVGEKLLKKSSWDLNESLVLTNALSVDHDRMRPSVVPSVLEKVAENAKHFEQFGLFEIGRSYQSDSKTFSLERNQLVVALYSQKENRFLELANLIEDLMTMLKVPSQLGQAIAKFPNPLFPKDWVGFHPNEHLDLKIMGKVGGAVVNIHPVLMKEFRVKGNLAMVVLDLNTFEGRPVKSKLKFKPLPKFPSSVFDCTVTLKGEEALVEVLDSLKGLKIKQLQSTKIVDVFSDKDERHVTVRATFNDPEGTISGDQVKTFEDSVIKALASKGFTLKSQ